MAPITVSSTTTINAIAYETGMMDSPVSSATYTIALPVAAPSFSPVGGTYTSTQTVTIGTATAGASIRYTTNGSAPSETVGTLYSGPITVSSTATINAIAYETGMTDSAISSAAYLVTNSWSISGIISPSSAGNGTTVTLSGAASVATMANASGNYTFTGLANGDYTVTPSASGYTFTPGSQTIALNGANSCRY